jgi:tetratricopeptide (TPR) repeat protein
VTAAGPMIDRLEILGELGCGGMGIVYKARDLELGRIVAIKTIAGGQAATSEQLHRFRAEAQAVARLRHPNIIAIHTIGEHQNRPYLSLEFAEGGNLAQRLVEKPMGPRESAELVETLARAVHAAHQAGVIHRDLKPSNILFTADGAPKVGDFGLAKRLDADSGRTLSGQPIGTPSYMAPEQAEGHSQRIGPAADVYALGTILYHTLTGRPPFLGQSAMETVRMVTSTEAVAPRQLRPDVPRDLETIGLKCLEKEPSRRYASAEDLANDLRCFLDGRPTAARPASAAERCVRWCRRNPWLAAVCGLLAATVLIAVSVVSGLTYRYTRDLRAEIHRTEAKAAEARRNYLEARSTIQGMLGRLDARRLDGVAQFLPLCREQREDAASFYDRVLSQTDSSDPLVLADTARALSEASMLEAHLDHVDAAEKYARRAVALIEGLRSRSQGTEQIEYLGLEVQSLMRLGNYLGRLQRHEEAIEIGRRSVEQAARRAEATPGDMGVQDLLANCNHLYAITLWLSRDATKDKDEGSRRIAEARSHYQRAIQIRESLDPKILPGLGQRLCESYTNQGQMQGEQGQAKEAEESFRQAEKNLLSEAPLVLGAGDTFVLNAAILYVNWSAVLHSIGRFDDAIAKTNAGLERIDRYVRGATDFPHARRACLALHGNKALALSGKKDHRGAVKEWERVIELSDQPVPFEHRIHLGFELAESGERARAIGYARGMKASDVASGLDCYNLASLYSVCAALARDDKELSAEQRKALEKSDLDDAMQWLRAAAAAGLFADPAQREHAKADPDLATLRNRKEFGELLESAGAKGPRNEPRSAAGH